MSDLFIPLKEIESELKEIENEGIKLAQKLSLLTQKIKYIFSKIQSCATIELAGDYFDLLDKIQFILARLVFKEGIGIPDRLRRFVRDFDNLEQNREYYFNKIKNGKYSF